MTPNTTVNATTNTAVQLVKLAGRGRLDVVVVPHVGLEELLNVSLWLEDLQVLRTVKGGLMGEAGSHSQLFERVYNRQPTVFFSPKCRWF